MLRNFDTWHDTEPENDSSSIKLVQFLRDSINESQYLFLALCDESFQVPIVHKFVRPGSPGSLDTLKEALKSYGSALADSLGANYSFAMIGRKGAKIGSIIENAKSDGDTVVLTGLLTLIANEGNFYTPWIGPAKKWNNMKISGDINTDSTLLQIKIFAVKKLTDLAVLIDSSDNVLNMDLLSYNSNNYPYIKFNISIKKLDKNANPTINSLFCDYEPAPEFVVIKSKSGVTKENNLRGDSVKANLVIKNISKRVKSNDTEITGDIFSSGNIPFTIKIPELAVDEVVNYLLNIVSDNLSKRNYVTWTVNPKMYRNELYDFNNNGNFSFNVYEDTIKPKIELYIDGNKISDNNYIQQYPKVLIKLKDNSRLPVLSNTMLWIRINGHEQNSSNTKNYEFVSYGYNTDLKAELTFEPQKLEIGQNSFIIYGSDASGNRDTLKLLLNVSLNGEISEFKIVPNPTSGPIRIEYNYIAPQSNSESEIIFYNNLGQRVKKILTASNVGKNTVYWDTRDENGNSLPDGLYFGILKINEKFYVEPFIEKIILMK